MNGFIGFYCPEHGWVCDIVRHSLVECHCGRECAPTGITPRAHRAWYFKVARQRRLDARNRQIRSAKPQVRAA